MSTVPEKDSLVDNVLKLTDRLFRRVFQKVPGDLLILDITMQQIKIMLILHLQGQRRMGDIASELDVTLPTATSLVDKLVEKNYVLRLTQPDDRRVVLCCLTDEGTEAVSSIWQAGRKRVKEIAAAMDVLKLGLFVDVLQAMNEVALTEADLIESN